MHTYITCILAYECVRVCLCVCLCKQEGTNDIERAYVVTVTLTKDDEKHHTDVGVHARTESDTVVMAACA